MNFKFIISETWLWRVAPGGRWSRGCPDPHFLEGSNFVSWTTWPLTLTWTVWQTFVTGPQSDARSERPSSRMLGKPLSTQTKCSFRLQSEFRQTIIGHLKIGAFLMEVLSLKEDYTYSSLLICNRAVTNMHVVAIPPMLVNLDRVFPFFPSRLQLRWCFFNFYSCDFFYRWGLFSALSQMQQW